MNFKKSSWVLMLGLLIAAGVASWLNVGRSSGPPPHTNRNAGLVDRPAAHETAAARENTRSSAEASPASSRTSSASPASKSASREYTTTSTQAATNGEIEAFTEPYRDIAAAAAEMGTISSISVREGQPVKAGEVLATMDERVLQAALEVARRSMTAEGSLKSAQADLTSKSEAVEKLRGLRDRGHASQQELERIESDREVAEARLLSVREDLEVKQLEFRRIEAQIEQRIIRTPMDGIVTELQREAGEFVSPSEPMIARVVQLDPLLIVFSVPLEHRNDLAKDQTVPVQIGEASTMIDGIVEFVAPTPDPSNSTVRVKVRIANPDQRFQSGERAVLKLAPDAAVPGESADSTPVARRDP